MRIKIVGNNSVCGNLRVWLQSKGFDIVDDTPDYTLTIIETNSKLVTLDSIDCDLERNILNQLYLNGVGEFKIKRAGGIQSDRDILIEYPTNMGIPVAKGVYQGLRMAIVPQKPITVVPEKKSRWKKILGLIGVVLVISIGTGIEAKCADMLQTKTPLFQLGGGQTFPIVRFWSGSVIVNAGDSVNNALRVNCILGCGGGGAVTANQGTANTQANRWPVFLSDGINAFGSNTNPFGVRLSDGTSFYDARTRSWALATGTDKTDVRLRNAADAAFIEPSTDRTTAAGPFSVRLTDGAAFYNGLKSSDTLTGVTTVSTVTTVSAVTAITNALPAGTNRIGSVRPVDSADADLTSAKGTQTSRFLGIQEVHDAGRTSISFYANAVASGTTGTETLITLTQSKGTGATSAAASYTITNGKTLRISAIIVGSRGHSTATAQITTFNLRMNTGGACVVGSTPILAGIATATPATALAWDRATIPFGEGYDIVGNGTIAICISANAVFVTNAPTWFVNIVGYEY